jgi:hypothetical protein
MTTQPGDRKTVHAPISIGELMDKISILEIKARHIAHDSRRQNVLNELTALQRLEAGLSLDPHAARKLLDELRTINAALWDIEDAIRELEARADFGPDFVALARKVYQFNDRRAQVKATINATFGSAIVEEKHYRNAPSAGDGKP